MSDSRGFFAALVGDGRSLISFSGLCLALAGGFALFQSTTGDFLPHDVRFLQMSADELCGINECRIVHFMVHDRVSFGGALIAIGVLYLWLAEFPLRAGEAWAWWILAISGLTGFGSFLAYLGYGYLDTWHGVATLTLLPCFVGGMWKARTLLSSDRARRSWRTLLRPASWPNNSALAPLGRSLLLLSACGMIAGGATIHYVGATEVFVPTDLTFMGIERSQFDAINPRLVPLIAHDRRALEALWQPPVCWCSRPFGAERSLPRCGKPSRLPASPGGRLQSSYIRSSATTMPGTLPPR